MNRRKFIKSNTTAAIATAGYTFMPDFLYGSVLGNDKKSYSEYLRKSAIPKEEIDIFLNENSWAQFDPEVGYILGNYMPHDGIDNSFSISTVMKDGKEQIKFMPINHVVLMLMATVLLIVIRLAMQKHGRNILQDISVNPFRISVWVDLVYIRLTEDL